VDSGSFRKAAKCISGSLQRVIAIEGPLARPQGGLVDRSAFAFGPLIEKFKSVLQSRDFLNEAVSALYENRAVKHPGVHQILQIERTIEL
jgi:hypothetical protein